MPDVNLWYGIDTTANCNKYFSEPGFNLVGPVFDSIEDAVAYADEHGKGCHVLDWALGRVSRTLEIKRGSAHPFAPGKLSVDTLHIYGPWLLLGAGVVGLLQVTILYGPLTRFGRWLLERLTFRRESFERLMPLLGRLIESAAVRWLSTLWSIALILGAIAWLALRP